MNKLAFALAAFVAATTLASASRADDGPFKGRMNTVGANCQRNTYFDLEASIVGDKVEGTIQGNTFRGPVKFAGDATNDKFTASLVFAQLNNLRVEITGARSDAATFIIATKWNGGGPNNCETSGPAKKG